MTPRTRRVLIVAAVSIVGLGGLAALGGLWVTNTENGARWGFERLGSVLPGKLEIGRLAGALRGPLEVRDVRYHNDRMDISVDRLALDWNLRDVIRQRIDVYWFEADSVRVAVFADTARAVGDSLRPELPDLDLPMDFMVRRGEVHDLYITPVGSDTATRIDEITMRSVAFRDTLRIGLLTVRSSFADLAITGSARPRGRYAVDLDTRWTLYRGADADVVGRGRLFGSLDTLRIGEEVSAPFHARVDAMVTQPLRDPRFDGVIAFDDLDLSRVDRDLPAGRAEGRVEFQGKLGAYTSRGVVDAVTAQWGRVRADYALESLGGGRYRFQQVTLTRPGRPGRLITRGTVLAGQRPQLDLNGAWDRLGWPLSGKETIQSAKGSFRIAGPIDRYRIAADGRLANATIPESRWKLAGTGNARGVALASIDGDPLGGAVTGSGHLDWSASVAWRFALAARGLNPGIVWAKWPGSVSMDVNTRGKADRSGTHGVAEVSRIAGTVREQPVSGQGSVEFHPDGYAIPALVVGWGPDRLTAAGSLRSRWNLNWAVDAPDVSVVVPNGAGRLAAKGELSGSRAAPHLVATVRGDSLRTMTTKLDSLTADADLDLGSTAVSRFDLAAVGIVTPRRALDRATLNLNGRRDAHEIRFAATSNTDSLRVLAQGGLPGDTWHGRLIDLDLVTDRFGTWALDTPAVLTAGASAARVDDFSWSSQGSRIRADAGWQRGGRWQVQSVLENVRLALLDPTLPPGLQLEGPLNGTIDANGSGGRIVGAADLAAGHAAMTYPSDGRNRGRTPIDTLTLRVRADQGGVRSETYAALGPAGTIRANLRTPNGGSNRIVDGTLQLRLQQLDFVAGLTPELSNVHGQLNGDLRVAGTFSNPRWIGEAHLTGATADMHRLGIHLDEVLFDATSEESGRLGFDGLIRSGTGRLTLEGDATFAANGTPHAHSSLIGQRFRILDRKDAEMLVSPDIQVTVVGDSVIVKGEVEVPEADIRSVKSQVQAVGPSPDVVYVGPDSIARRPRPLKLYSEVRVALGRRVRFRAMGLDGKPTGTVSIVYRPDFPATGSGELRLTEGTYQTYGQNLKIDRGRLIFAGGPVANPNLDVRASRRARDGVVAGFVVQGTLEAPRFSLFSEPQMAERDALAYVVLGHKLDQANNSQEAIVTDAANSLELRGGTFVAGTLARQLGISEAAIESEGSFEEASLMLGTYLSPRLYVNYGVGIVDAVSTLRIQYFLNSKWTLQAEAGNENRAQVLYTVEK